MAQSSDGWQEQYENGTLDLNSSEVYGGMIPQPGYGYQPSGENRQYMEGFDPVHNHNHGSLPTGDFGANFRAGGLYNQSQFNDVSHDGVHQSQAYAPPQTHGYTGYGQEFSNGINQETQGSHMNNSQMYSEPIQQIHSPFQGGMPQHRPVQQYANHQGRQFYADHSQSMSPFNQSPSLGQAYASHYGNSGHDAQYSAIPSASGVALDGSNGRSSVHSQQGIPGSQGPYQSPHQQIQFQPQSYSSPLPQRSSPQQIVGGQNPTVQASGQHVPGQPMPSPQTAQQLQYQHHTPHEQLQFQHTPQHTPQQLTPQQQAAPQLAGPQLAAAQLAGPQQASPQQASPQQASPQQASPQQAPPQHLHYQQTPPQQIQYQQTPGRQVRVQQVQELTPTAGQQLQGTAPVARSTPIPTAYPAAPTVAPQPEQIWTQPEGCPYAEVSNPPLTRIGKFADLELPSSLGPKEAPPRRYLSPLLPQRRTRLPSEIHADLLNEQDQERIEQLKNEPVIIAISHQHTPGHQDIAVKASSKRRVSNMADSTKKAKASNGAREETVADGLARKIKENKRPDNPAEAVEYDIVAILWRDPTRPEPSQEAVQKSVTAFGTYVTDLWSESKKLKSDMEEALAKNDRAKSESLRTDMEGKYALIRTAIEATLKYGDKFTTSQLGIHTRFLGGLFVMLRNFFQGGDYTGPLPKAIMRLASMFVTVDTEFLKDKVKFDKVYLKYKNGLDEEAQGYLDQIFENAKKRSSLNTRADPKPEDGKKPISAASTTSKKPAATPGKESPATSKALSLKKDVLVKKPAPEIKRMQPTDYSGLGSARKVSKRPVDEDADSRASKKAAVENAAGAPTSKAQSTSAPSSSPAPSVVPPARATPSGSMLPGRSRVVARPAPRRQAPQQTSTFSNIGNLLASIAKPKEEKPKQTQKEERAPETPEELERRLRKESRRHLHVAWKPDHELIEVRLFEHDTAEFKGRDRSMLRDARDNRSEGQMLKQRVRDDVEDEDDDGAPTEVILNTKRAALIPITPALIDPAVREKTYVTRGGVRAVESQQARVMEERENRELMAIYTSLSEIPESPRSPSKRVDEASQRRVHVLPSTPAMWQQTLPPNTPLHAEIHRRWSDHLQFGPAVASQLLLQRRRTGNQPTLSSGPATHPTNSRAVSQSRPRTREENDAETFALLTSARVKNYVDPEPYDPKHPMTHRRHDYADPKVQRDVDALEDVFAQFKDKPFPANEPPAHISSNPQRVAEWHAGRNLDMATQASQSQLQVQPQAQQAQPTPINLQRILQHAQALNRSGPPAPAPAPVPVPVPAPAPVAPAQPTPDLQSILATLAITVQKLATQAAPVPAPVPTQQSAAPEWATLWAQNVAAQFHGAQPQSQPQPTGYTGHSQASAGYGTQPQASTGYGAQPQAHQSYGGYGQSSLAHGDYSHSQDAQNQRDYNDRGNRKENSHRGGPNKDHKGINRALIGTKPCTFWAKGQCAKGDNCTFRHDLNDLK